MRRIVLMLPVVCLALACSGEDDGATQPPPKKDEPAECTGGGLVGGGSCTTSGSKTLGVRCEAESECAANETCVNAGFGDGYCLKECATDTDCGSGSRCESTGSGSAKACIKSCSSDSECPGDTVCSEFNGGKYCGPNRKGGACLFDSQCPSSWTCLGTAGYYADQRGVCTADCTSNASICGEGAKCVAVGATGTSVCLRQCTDAGDCDDGHTCSENYCQPLKSSTPRPVGSACTASSDCESGLFCASAANGWVGGYCTNICSSNTDCDSRATCIILNDTTNVCMQTCWDPGAQSNCRDGYICNQVTGEDYGVCVVRQ